MELQTFSEDEPLLRLLVKLMTKADIMSYYFVISDKTILNNAQLVDQEFLHIDLHPKDGILEMNEFTTFFADLDTDGILV